MPISQHLTLTENYIDSSRSWFVIEPLEPGFGYAPDSSLRRTLLSSIPSVAVTGIRIDGVLHGFTTIPGVKKDVPDIILNIKGLVLSNEFGESATVYLRRKGAGAVTAANIECPAGVETYNPDHRIATLNESGRLKIEVIVEHGRGYVPMIPNSGDEISRTPMDQIYPSVLRVSYKVEATCVEQRTGSDRLIIGVETKNSITIHDAMASVGRTLVELSGLAHELSEAVESIRVGPSSREAEDAVAYQTLTEDLNFSMHPYNCLKREGIYTVGELAARTKLNLLDIRNLGDKFINEVREKLAELSLAPKNSPNNFDPVAIADLGAASGDDADWTDGASAGYDE